MYKCRTSEVAKSIAKENNLCYGLSVFGDNSGHPSWYVGTLEQLEKIGVPKSAMEKP